ncbi:filamin-B isoform X1 [Drosophila guanche]|uniref:Blast:Filamin-B n=1 Tax=Drosophila guanche TaxID=7266 RepID=A0A3B0K7M4_DROGU|nr:filamin-B isoform X1 [Drosophila guanche]SPP80991.1 blast:Filamin-B [Drosophila guanche]
MFKASQELRLNTNSAASASLVASASGGLEGPCVEKDCIFGRYQRTPDAGESTDEEVNIDARRLFIYSPADAYPTEPPRVYIAPELTDASRAQLLHFPSGAVRTNSSISFILKRNGVKGNFDVRVEGPSGQLEAVQQQQLDPERFQIDCKLSSGAGLYKVHVKCNSVSLPRSPFIIVAIAGAPETSTDTKSSSPEAVTIIQSDASKVQSRGLGLSHVSCLERNEFTVDCSQAGSNMLFVGILGPRGPCDELLVKHLGRNIHRVTYRVSDPGDYTLAAKWGEQHIPGSPFSLATE